MTPNLNLWLIPVLPLVGASINGLFGKRFSRQTVLAIALGFSGAAFVMALWIAAQFSSLALPHVENPRILDTRWRFSGGLRVLPRSTFIGDVTRRHRASAC